MNLNDIVSLVNAGFTKADILAFAAGQTQQEQAQEQPKEPEPETAQEPEPETKAAPDYAAEIGNLKNQISALQRANILNASQPAGANSKQTLEDVWKNFFEGDEK